MMKMKPDFNNKEASKINSSRNEKIMSALSEFDHDLDLSENDDNKTFSELTEVKIPVSSETTDKIAEIGDMLKKSVLDLKGYVGELKGDYYVYNCKKEPKTIDEVIRNFELLLSPHANKSNLISKKKWSSYSIEV